MLLLGKSQFISPFYYSLGCLSIIFEVRAPLIREFSLFSCLQRFDFRWFFFLSLSHFFVLKRFYFSRGHSCDVQMLQVLDEWNFLPVKCLGMHSLYWQIDASWKVVSSYVRLYVRVFYVCLLVFAQTRFRDGTFLGFYCYQHYHMRSSNVLSEVKNWKTIPWHEGDPHSFDIYLIVKSHTDYHLLVI